MDNYRATWIATHKIEMLVKANSEDDAIIKAKKIYQDNVPSEQQMTGNDYTLFVDFVKYQDFEVDNE